MEKLNSKTLYIILIMVTFTLIAACGSDSNTGNADDGGDESLVIGTGGSSGTYYAVGAGMSNVLTENSNLNAISQGTNGAIENVRLVSEGAIDIGFGNWDALYFGHEGTNAFDEPQGTQNLMTLYLSAGQMAVKENSDIERYEDLEGKAVNLGPKGSTITEMSKIILESYGIDPEEDIEPYYLSFQEGGTKLRDNDLDATFYVAGIPTSGLIDLSTGSDIRLLSINEEHRDQILEEYPYYEAFTIPADTYEGIDYEVETLQLWTSLHVSEDMSEDTAYKTVKTLIENIEAFKEVHNVGKDFSLENAAKTPIPMHPGAKKYFEEQGITVEE